MHQGIYDHLEPNSMLIVRVFPLTKQEASPMSELSGVISSCQAMIWCCEHNPIPSLLWAPEVLA